MRELLYAAYLRFPRAFYDVHPTGQVVSRATNDLYPIRYFIGWGLVQGAQSRDDARRRGHRARRSTNPSLALWSALPLPLIALVAWRFAHRVMPISREVQQRKGDVTESANEAVVGIEMVQAFGREGDVQDALRRARRRGPRRGPAPGAGRVPPPARPLLPAVAVGRGRALPRRPAGDRRHADLRRVRAVHPAAAAARVAARVDGLDHQPRPARARLGRPVVRLARDRPDAARARRSRSRSRRGEPLGVELRDVHFAYAGGEPVLRGVDLDGRARRGARGLRRRPARASPRCSGSSRASTTRRDGIVRSAAATCATLPIADVHAATALVTQRPDPVLRDAARQPARPAARTRRGRRSSAPARSRA